MNRERNLHSYRQELGFCPVENSGSGWLDFCCGEGRALKEADCPVVGVDLVGPLYGEPSFELHRASWREWETERRFDLITCVHGVHYMGDKVGFLCRAADWLSHSGLLVADFDPSNLRWEDGKKAVGLLGWLRDVGFEVSTRKRKLTLRGCRTLSSPYDYLGADPNAGPNYTGQPAVNSYYRREA